MDMCHPVELSAAAFVETVSAAVGRFPANGFIRKLHAGNITMQDYHCFLLMILHQTFNGPSSFALAAGHCDARKHAIRDYLIQHAEEERSHWRWVLADLEATGYSGPDPLTHFPPFACQNYISFNVFLAVRHPISRLGAAAYLEGVGAHYGKSSAQKLAMALKLTPKQMVFLLGHGDTDVGHANDIYSLLASAELSPYDWGHLAHAAHTASRLYETMYDDMAANAS